MKKQASRILAGIDLGWWTHVVCALDSKGNFLQEASFSHDAASLTEIGNWLLKLAKGDPSRIAVATEKPHGAVVDSLLTRSIAVYSINPKQVDRFRDRHSIAGAKDDRRDAFVLADALRTDGQRFQRVELPTPPLLALREQLRMDEDLRQEEIALANRLRDHLVRGQPHLLKLAPANLVDPFFWEILEQFGTPQKAHQAQLPTLQALLRQHHIRRLNAAQVFDVLQSPPLPVAPGTLEAAASPIDFLVKRLRLIDQQRRLCAKQIDSLLNALGAPDKRHLRKAARLTDGVILSSLPGVGRVVLAILLSEAYGAIRRRDLAALRALGGVAPVTKQSGKSRQVVMRRACNPALRNALYHWGLIAIHKDPRFKKHYDQLRARGYLHARAVRGVMDRILNIATAMLRHRTLYDRSRHGESAA
jgi:transposase